MYPQCEIRERPDKKSHWVKFRKTPGLLDCLGVLTNLCCLKEQTEVEHWTRKRALKTGLKTKRIYLIFWNYYRPHSCLALMAIFSQTGQTICKTFKLAILLQKTAAKNCMIIYLYLYISISIINHIYIYKQLCLYLLFVYSNWNNMKIKGFKLAKMWAIGGNLLAILCKI